MKISLPIKYALSVSAIIVATAITLSATFISRHIDTLKRNLVGKGQSLVKSLADHSEFGMLFLNPRQLQAIASSLLEQDDVVYAVITDLDGNIVVFQGDQTWREKLPPADPTSLTGASESPYRQIANETSSETAFHFDSRIYSETFETDEPELTLLSEAPNRSTVRREIGVAHLGISLNGMQAEIAQARQRLLFVTLIIVLAGIATAVLLSMYVTRPIQNLVAATHQIADGNLDYSIDTETRDEIGDLAQSFNKMTKALQRTTVSRNYVDNIIKSMNDILIVTAPDGAIERVNAAACECLGFEEIEMVGRNLEDIIRTPSGDRCDLDRILNDNPLMNVERVYITRDNRRVPVLFSGSSMRDGDLGIHKIVTVAQDITRLKIIEDDLRHAKDVAEKANAAKSEFLANMSHELRTPLHSILSFADLGMDKIEIGGKQKLFDYFQEIDQNGRILLQLLNSLLDLAKLESGKTSFHFEETPINDLVGAVVNEFAMICSENKIEIYYDEPATPFRCVADTDKIKQVVRNILANAVRFSPAGGKIDVTITSTKNVIRVAIGDQGIGIPPEELNGIFQKFVQSSKTKTGAGGTGLGLAISREIISKHNGRIWAQNQTPHGALFCFELPIRITIFSDTETKILTRDKGAVIKQI